MTGADLAVRLAAAGLPPDEISSKARLCDAVVAMCRATDPSRASGPSHAWWVPGRLELFGKHTDYAGGRTIVAAVPRGFIFAASPRQESSVRVVDAKDGERVDIGAGTEPALTGWRRYVAVVVSRLSRNFPGARSGATIAFTSDLPRASGMSSSSALVVGVASALTELWDLRSREEWQRDIRTPEDLATYYACIENGATFGRLAGDAGVGTRGGSEDHAAMLLARAGSVSAFSFVPMRLLDVARIPDVWTLVIATSGVKAEKTGAARDAYNRLSEGTRRLTGLWNAHEEPCGSLASALASGPGAVDRLHALIDDSCISNWPHDALHRRLDHFHREDARVPRAIEAIAKRDGDALRLLGEESQRDAEILLGNQIPETIALAAEARQHGAIAACSFGAGFGGSVWAIVPAEASASMSVEWLARYRVHYPQSAAISFTAAPGPPVSDLR